jgi:predicted dehydrogenase
MEHVITHGSDLIDVRAICDPSAESLAATKEAIAPNAVVVDDYRDLVKDPSIDWVMVGSWNCFHREHVLAAFEAGKNVFCEKPLATTIEDCLAIRAAWRQAGIQFMIGFTLRYSPHYRKIHELLNTGAIGQLISMEFNDPFSSEKSIADNQVAIIEYESGVRATFHTNMNVGIPERRMYLCGTEGSIRADVISGQIEVGRIGFDEKIERIDLGIRGSHGGGDAVLGLNIVNCMKGEENPYTGLDHGLISAFTCFAIDEAVAANAVVPLAPYWAKL